MATTAILFVLLTSLLIPVIKLQRYNGNVKNLKPRTNNSPGKLKYIFELADKFIGLNENPKPMPIAAAMIIKINIRIFDDYCR